MQKLIMIPAPGERLLRYAGDQVVFTLKIPVELGRVPQVSLRTTIGRAEAFRSEIIETYSGTKPLSLQFWRDVPMVESGHREWRVALVLHEVGFFLSKAYFINQEGHQVWPDGLDTGISVHPNEYRTANTIYCAFTRMFGKTKTLAKTKDPVLEEELKRWDQKGYTVIPPSGKLRDLTRELSHIIKRTGCRILHLLPVNTTPTTLAKFGRFGSPYACEDLTAVDPALVEFDKKTTGIEQFQELTFEAHLRGARVFLDMVINHTGWGSVLYENHPEWFVRNKDNTFASPGAWGTTWEDLVELDTEHRFLWDEFARAFMVWCRRGVDGFRCDAGYKIPVQVWQYIIAKVRQEFPQTIFLLEGLGGSWEATENLLTSGGMQWAYSELFQNYTPEQVSTYLDHSMEQSQRTGLYVHYSETHDNERLAKKGRAWSLLRNQLSALTSVSGGFGFTCGVEWLADEKIEVHQSRGLRWDHKENIKEELRRLNELLQQHPCFFDGALLKRLSAGGSQVFVLHRQSADARDHLLILINLSLETEAVFDLDLGHYREIGSPAFDLLSGIPAPGRKTDALVQFRLYPAQSLCLAGAEKPNGLVGDDYRILRAQAEWAFAALAQKLKPENLGEIGWKDLANLVQEDALKFLVGVANLSGGSDRSNLLLALQESSQLFSRVVQWSMPDRKRVVLVPAEHWILIQDPRPFRCVVEIEDLKHPMHLESVPVRGGHVAFVPALDLARTAVGKLKIERYGLTNGHVEGKILFLRPKSSEIFPTPFLPEQDALALLTNGRGSMARLRVDLGQVYSKYDCALGANLAAEIPVDRHVFVKRVRIWASADGFIRPLDGKTIRDFHPGPPARWRFAATAGENKECCLTVVADMVEKQNIIIFRITRQSEPRRLNHVKTLSLAMRADIEDRNFHSETHRSPGADLHFSSHTRRLDHQIGFVFEPDRQRRLQVFCDKGFFHSIPEWAERIPHPIEVTRGQMGDGDAFSPGWFQVDLEPGESTVLVLSAESHGVSEDQIRQFESYREMALLHCVTRAQLNPEDGFGKQLAIAAQAYVVQRGPGKTVIAGYPWFLDWGRDSLICARGLLAAGLVDEVHDLLVTFGRFVENGTMPNTIHGNDATNRDTSDAALWFGVACEDMAQINPNFYQTRVDEAGRNIAEVLREIARGYFHGTPNGIRCDKTSGLIWSPKHFTWMDTNYPAGTPREGYPVEIQALWIRLLRQLGRIESPPLEMAWADLAALAEASLEKFFWVEERQYLADLVIAPAGVAAAEGTQDNALRSNGLFAVSLGIISGDRAKKTVEAALRHLVVPGALRSLAPMPVFPPLPIHAPDGRLLNNPLEPYFGQYEGDEDTRRKRAYHNGTAWTWTFPTFCEALAVAWDNQPIAVQSAQAYLSSMQLLLTRGCLGQIPEILDGDAPHQERGCDAQAWGVTEALRVWKWLKKLQDNE